MTSRREDAERTRVAAVEASFSAVMLVGGVLVTQLTGAPASLLGLVLAFFGVGGLGHAVLLGIGLIDAVGAQDVRGSERKDDDAR
jgi:hypothetical protein